VPGTVPPGDETANVAVVSVDGSIARENAAVIAVVDATSIAPVAGTVVSTVGAAGAVAAVVNDHAYGAASGTPSVVWIVVASRAVYVSVRASMLVGVRVAVRVDALYDTVAGTSAPDDERSENPADVTVAGSIARVNVARMDVVGPTSTASKSGLVESTSAGGAACVVNDQLYAVPSGAPSDDLIDAASVTA